MLTDYEGSAYSVDTALSSGKTFDGYTFDTLKGAPSGKLNKDTGINVYFVKKSTPTEPSKLTEPNTPTDPTTPAQTATNIPDSTTPADTQIFDTQVPLTNTPTAGKTHGGPEVPPPRESGGSQDRRQPACSPADRSGFFGWSFGSLHNAKEERLILPVHPGGQLLSGRFGRFSTQGCIFPQYVLYCL